MYCSNCGRKIEEGIVYCPNCGRAVRENVMQESSKDTDKTLLGVLCAMFLGVIGLIVGLILYSEKPISKRSFLRGWLATFAILIILATVIIVVIYTVFFGIV